MLTGRGSRAEAPPPLVLSYTRTLSKAHATRQNLIFPQEVYHRVNSHLHAHLLAEGFPMVWTKKFARNIRFSLNTESPPFYPRLLGEVGVKKKYSKINSHDHLNLLE